MLKFSDGSDVVAWNSTAIFACRSKLHGLLYVHVHDVNSTRVQRQVFPQLAGSHSGPASTPTKNLTGISFVRTLLTMAQYSHYSL